jgi:glutaredoxin
VPEEGKEAVRVVLADPDFAGDGDLLYVADLRRKKEDGTYPITTMPRSAWELIAEKRRQKTMAAFRPKASTTAKPGTAPTAAISGITAVLYMAPWCNACRSAARYMRRRGLQVIEKNIEADAGAKREMQQKLRRARLPDRGSIPVIDIRGQLILGYNERDIDRAIKAASKGTQI